MLASAGTAVQGPVALTTQGTRALAAGDLKAALTNLRQAAKLDPSNLRIQFNLGLTLVRMGKPDEAIGPLNRAARDPSLAAEAQFLLGASYFEARQYQKAIARLEGLERSAHAERALYMLEESNRLLNHEAQAREAFRELNRRFPDSAWTHFLMATAYENQQQWDVAIKEYQKALKADPTIPNASFAIGYIYWREQNMDAAREWLGKEAARGCHALSNFYLGEIAQRNQNLTSAERFYRESLRCDSSLADAHARLGILLARLKRYRESIAQLKEAVRLQPANSASHYHLAVVYRELGRKAEADAEYAKVRQLQAAADTGSSQDGVEARP